MGEDKDAEVILNNVVCILPNLIMPWYHLGQIETKKGNIKKADQYFLYSIVLGSRNYLKIEDAKRYINSGEIHKNIKQTNSLYSNYCKKFSDWYRSVPLIIDKK